MTTGQRLVSLLAMTVCALAINVRAQSPSVSTVNVTAEADRVRVSPQGDIFDLKIEVTDESGETVFEAGAAPVYRSEVENFESEQGWPKGQPRQ